MSEENKRFKENQWLYELTSAPTRVEVALVQHRQGLPMFIRKPQIEAFEKKSRRVLDIDIHGEELPLLVMPVQLDDVYLEGPEGRVDGIIVGRLGIVKNKWADEFRLLLSDGESNREVVDLDPESIWPLYVRMKEDRPVFMAMVFVRRKKKVLEYLTHLQKIALKVPIIGGADYLMGEGASAIEAAALCKGMKSC